MNVLTLVLKVLPVKNTVVLLTGILKPTLFQCTYVLLILVLLGHFYNTVTINCQAHTITLKNKAYQVHCSQWLPSTGLNVTMNGKSPLKKFTEMRTFPTQSLCTLITLATTATLRTKVWTFELVPQDSGQLEFTGQSGVTST